MNKNQKILLSIIGAILAGGIIIHFYFNNGTEVSNSTLINSNICNGECEQTVINNLNSADLQYLYVTPETKVISSNFLGSDYSFDLTLVNERPEEYNDIFLGIIAPVDFSGLIQPEFENSDTISKCNNSIEVKPVSVGKTQGDYNYDCVYIGHISKFEHKYFKINLLQTLGYSTDLQINFTLLNRTDFPCTIFSQIDFGNC